MTNSVEELEDAECILIIGSNTTVSHPVIATRIFRAREKGAKIIVVDPRRTQIASYADLYLAEKSGTDVALVNGLLHIIIKEGWYAKEFVEKRTEGFEFGMAEIRFEAQLPGIGQGGNLAIVKK